VLEPEEHEPFRDLWVALEKVHADDKVAGPLRRFTFAAERALPEDKIVDLVIAAESLFLGDIKPSDRGELRFRLSTRVALLLGETVAERKQIFAFMRRAYDARSGLAHGGSAGEKNLRAVDGKPVSAAEFASALEDVIRRALQLAVQRLAGREGFPPDWEDLMFELASE